MSGRSALLWLALALTYPVLDQLLGWRQISTVSLIVLFMILAQGLNLVVGFAGLLHLGYASFFAVGALTMGHLTSPQSPWQTSQPWGFWPALTASCLLTASLGGLLTWPLRRLRGDYLALVTMGFGLMLDPLLRNFDQYTKALTGLSGVAAPQLLGWRLDSQNALGWYALYTLLLLATVVLARALQTSGWGSRLRALRENPIAAAACGISSAQGRLLVLTLSSAIAGLAGGLYASSLYTIQFAFPLDFNGSVMLLAMVVLGGPGSIHGTLLGALTIGGLNLLVAPALSQLPFLSFLDLAKAQYLIYGGILVAVTLWRPQGLWPEQAIRYPDRPSQPAPSPLPEPLPPGRDLLRARGLSRRFGGLWAVRALDFDLPVGPPVAVIGPNGAGKTTLFNILTGITAASQGTVELQGIPLPPSPETRARLGLTRTFQNIRLFSSLTALENVLLGQSARSPASRPRLGSPFLAPTPQALVDAYDVLQRVGLEAAAHQTAGNLPYGHQRLLEIARALAGQPKVLMLDEPAAGMNPSETQQLGQLIERLHEQGVTVLVIEHDVPFVQRLACRITVLDHGQKIAEGPPSAVLSEPRVVEAYLGVPDEKGGSAT